MRPPPSALIQPAFQTLGDRLELRLCGAGALQGIDELTIIDLALANPPGAIAGDLPGHELAEDRGDRPVAGQASKVGPDVVCDVDPRHTVATSWRDGDLGLQSLSAATPHFGYTEAYTRKRRISVQVRLSVLEALALWARGPCAMRVESAASSR